MTGVNLTMMDFEIKKRYWIPVKRQEEDSRRPGIDMEARLDSMDEYMPEPNSIWNYGQQIASEAEAPRCLVLLGEMGVGKTTLMGSLKEESKGLHRSIKSRSFIEFSSGEGLRSLLIEASSSQKVLYLDGLDENQNNGVLEALKNTLEDDVDQSSTWKLRISCRSADWDPSLESILKKVFGDDHVQVVRLAPLCESDVRDAANQVGIDADQFLKAVDERGLVSFARLPLTLGFLLSSWEKNQNLEGNRWEFYQKGCLSLCKDHRGRKQENQILIPEQRMKIAALIALTLRLGGKNHICLDDRRGGTGIPVAELRWCAKRVLENVGDVEADQYIDDVLTNTALFKGDAGTRAPEHQSYIDFLAAYCLSTSGMEQDAWRKLLNKEGITYPHERGVVGWLCYRDETFRQYILEKDFKTLLLSGVDCLEHEERKVLVDQVLSHALQWQGLVGGFRCFQYYRILNHKGLGKQLREWLNKKDNEEARIEALAIARTNRVQDLSNLLTEIALDQNESTRLRTDSISALGKMGKTEDIQKLESLLNEETKFIDNSIKESVLSVLWPNGLIGAERVFSILDGSDEISYRSFINYELIDSLRYDDLQIGLEWVAKIGRPYFWAKGVNTIIWRSWDVLFEQPELQASFKKVVVHFLQHDRPVLMDQERYGDIRDEKTADDKERRQLLLELLINDASADDLQKIPSMLMANDWPLTEDFEFLLRSAVNADDPNIAKCWGELSRSIFAFSNDLLRTHGEFIYDLVEYHEVLSDVYRSYLGPIKLKSPESKKMKQSHTNQLKREQKSKEWKESQKGRKLPQEVLVNMIQDDLDLFQKGDLSKWIAIVSVIAQSKSSHLIDYNNFDLSLMKGWKGLPEDFKKKIRSAAWVYLRGKEAVVSGDKDLVYSDNVSAYVALYYLFDLSFLKGELRELIAKWAPAIVHQLIFSSSEKDGVDIHQKLLEVAFEEAPDVTTTEVVRRLKWDSKKNQEAYQLNRFDGIRSEKLYSCLVDFIREYSIEKSFTLSVLERLLKWGYEPVVQYILEKWEEVDNQGKVSLSICLIKSKYIKENWCLLWKWMKSNPEEGKKCLLGVVNDLYGNEKYFTELNGSQRKDLYLFLEENFPRIDDPKQNSSIAHRCGADDYVRGLRNGLLNLFGSNGEVEELEIIRDHFPEQTGFKRLIEKAAEVLLNKNAIYYDPGEVRSILRTEIVPGSYSSLEENPIRILHLSDLHFNGRTSWKSKLVDLKADIQKSFRGKIDYVLITGDFTDKINPKGMKKAVEFVVRLLEDFELTSSQLLFIPGNHDIDDAKVSFSSRFNHFKNIIHKRFYSDTFPRTGELSVEPRLFPEDRIQFLLLNSCWEIKKEKRDKISINIEARADSFGKAENQVKEALRDGVLRNNHILRIALFHHPVRGYRELAVRSILKGKELCDSLLRFDTQLCLHGDIHDMNRDEVLDQHHSGEEILFIAGAGSFSVPRKDLEHAVGNMYSLLEIARDLSIIRVNVRWKKNDESPFTEYPEWPIKGRNTGKVGHYYINLKEKRVHTE